jgi:hypothetical protein
MKFKSLRGVQWVTLRRYITEPQALLDFQTVSLKRRPLPIDSATRLSRRHYVHSENDTLPHILSDTGV